MRISTSMQYQSHLNYLQTANTKVDQASTQYNTGLKFQTAGQDPGGMAAKIKYQADITAYERYGDNAKVVSDALDQEETALGQIWDVMSSIQTRLIQAINGTLDDGSRQALAEDIKQSRDQLYSLMNTKNAEGEYIFSGAQSNIPTFTVTSDGNYVCNADGSTKNVNVSPTITVQTTDSGLNIFENVMYAYDFGIRGQDLDSGGTIAAATVSDYDQFNAFFKDNFTYGSNGEAAGWLDNAFVVIISAVLFLFSPKIKNKMLSISPDFQEVTYHHQLKNKAESFASLYQQLIDIFKEETKKTNISEYIGFVYEEVCSGCPSRDYCFYSQEGMSRLGKLINKGMTSELDLKDIDYIQRHCLNPDDYLESIDHQQKSFHKMVKVNSVNENMKKELFQEFAVMGRVFENFSKNIKADDEERQIKEQLLAYKFDVLYVKKNGFNQNYTLEIGLEDISSEMIEEELIPILENYLGETLDVVSIDQRHHYLGYASVVLRHELKYAIMFSRQQYALDSSQCGDSYISFDHDHHHYIALSDGMGQGYVAHKESELTLNVLYQLIHNDIGLKDTLNTVNALLKIKNQGDMYTTLDLLDFNLINGRVKVIKYGANDSFLLRHNRIDVITSHSLPVGMAGRLKILSYDVKVQAGDIFIMTSDGVGEHFLRLLETHKEKIAEMDVYEIASFLFNQAFPEKKLDDMTILVMKVISRK